MRKYKYFLTLLIAMLMFPSVIKAAAAGICVYEYENTKTDSKFVVNFPFAKNEKASKNSLYSIVQYKISTNERIKTYGQQKISKPLLLDEDRSTYSISSISVNTNSVINAFNGDEKKVTTCPTLYFQENNRQLVISGTKIVDEAVDSKTVEPSSKSTLNIDEVAKSYQKTIDNNTFTFGITEKKGYYFKVENKNGNSDSKIFYSTSNVSLSIKEGKTNSADYYFMVRPEEVEEIWNSPKKTLYAKSSMDQSALYLTLDKDLNGWDTKGSSSGYVIINVTDPTGTAKSKLQLNKICKNTNTRKTMRFIGYILLIAKILVPILLIYSGVVLLAKTLLSGNDDNLKKNVVELIKKIIIAIIIFFIPTIVNIIFSLTEEVDDVNETYKTCRTCIFNPTKCNVGE